MRQIEIQTLGRIEVPDEWGDAEIKTHILDLRAKALTKSKPVPAMNFKGSIEIDCTVPWPIVRGDLQNITEHLQKIYGSAFEWGADSWWHVAPKHVSELVDLLSGQGYKVDVKIVTPPKTSSAGSKSAMTSPAGATKGSGGTGTRQSQPATPAVVTVHGTIERCQAGMAGKAPIRQVTLLLADKTKPTYSTFDKALFERLDAGLGKAAVMVIKQNGKYWNITGVRQIGSKEWDEDGTPIIQRKDQEAGGKTLF